jgi:tRNA(fMet)-specific endonuclease VapC
LTTLRARGTCSANVTDPVFLLDTNICIYLLGGTSEAARARVEACAEGELAVSTITVAEAMVGVGKLDSVAEARQFFRTLRIYPFDEQAAMTYAGLPFRRGSFDRLIAAHALALGLTLVTNNERDYSGIPGLRIANWTRE